MIHSCYYLLHQNPHHNCQCQLRFHLNIHNRQNYHCRFTLSFQEHRQDELAGWQPLLQCGIISSFLL